MSTTPLAARTSTGWFYADVHNDPVGPFQFTALQALAESGVILDVTLVIQEGESEWRRFAEVVNADSTSRVGPMAADANQSASTQARPDFVVSPQTDAPVGVFAKAQNWFPKNWGKPAALAVIALLAFTSLAVVLSGLLRLAARHGTPSGPNVLKIESLDGIVLRGSAFYADEQAYRETTSAWREGQFPASPTPTAATVGKIEIYQPKPESAAMVKERERSEAAWRQLEKQGRVWSETFDVPLRIVREMPDFGAVLVEPAKGFHLRRSQVWVSKSSFFPRSHPLVKGWASKRFVSQSGLKLVFTGSNYAHVDGVYVKNASDMLTGIFEGKISVAEAKRYAFTEANVSAGLETVLKDYLIFATRVASRERAEFALRRNRTIEAARNNISESELDSRDDIFNGYDPLLGGPIVVSGEEEFTTRGGFVKRLPVLEIVNLVP